MKLIVPVIEAPTAPATDQGAAASPNAPAPDFPQFAPPNEPAAPQFPFGAEGQPAQEPIAPQTPSITPPPQPDSAPSPPAFDPFALPGDAPAQAAPQVSQPAPATPPAPASPPAVDESGVPPAPDWLKPNASDQGAGPVFPAATPDATQPTAPQFPGAPTPDGNLSASGSEQPAIGRPQPSMASRVRRRTKKKKSGLVFAAICGIGLAIGMGYLYSQRGPNIEGKRKGVMLAGGKLEPKTLDKSLVDVSSEVTETVLQHFVDPPKRLMSQLVTTEFRGSVDGLEVTIATGTESRFVKFKIDSELRRYYDDNQETLNKPRLKVLKKASKEFFKKWDVAIRNSEGIDDFNQYRDSVGLNSCRGALGFHVSAQVGKGLYPCVYEDEGNLYFAVPPNTKRFKVVGNFTDGKKSLFPGKYDVVVSQEKKSKSAPAPITVDDDENGDDQDAKMMNDPKADGPSMQMQPNQ